MKVTIRLFSRLREICDTGEFLLELEPEATIGDVLRRVLEVYPELAPHEASMLAAVNEEWAPRDRRLVEGDELALMPPVSGG